MLKTTTRMLVAILMTVSVAAPCVAVAGVRKASGQGSPPWLSITFPGPTPTTTTTTPAPPAK
jgi:hypothetical protein